MDDCLRLTVIPERTAYIGPIPDPSPVYLLPREATLYSGLISGLERGGRVEV